MLKAYQYRLYPTKAHTTVLNRTFDLCRKVYNNTLALKRDSWDYDVKSVSLFETNKELTIWKQDYPELSSVYSQVLQNVQVRVDLAFKAFFQRVKKGGDKAGYPRFKSFGRYDSITYPQMGFSLDVQNQMIFASKIGKIRALIHRPIEGTIKTMTIRRSCAGKWYVSFAAEYEPEIKVHSGEEVTGIDLGLTSFATLSNGEKIENPRFFRREEQALAKVQRRLSKEEKGTPERAKRRLIVAKVHDRIANKRKNFIHQESRKLVDRYKLIAFEDLKIKNMQQNSHLSKSIADVSWGMMVQATTNKAGEAGSLVVLVDPKNTSQLCSRCNQIVRKELSDRVHCCPFCGLTMDRDQNAAINIMRLGLQSPAAKAT
ncbi:RNA-guided endonuclease InsQ/TnpB family protein [Methanoregula sp.]|uniref:RNA-guided endonuclease InsQ/TnpB family protein n=1 Tax=Methanoregula sp. TaxID=2052170 RepID=UPI003BAF1893